MKKSTYYCLKAVTLLLSSNISASDMHANGLVQPDHSSFVNSLSGLIKDRLDMRHFH